MPKKRLLLITDHFHPKGNIASLRTSALARYLCSESLDVFVLTTGLQIENEKYFGAQVYRVSDEHIWGRFTFKEEATWLVHKFKAAWNRAVRLIEIDENPGFAKSGWLLTQKLHQKFQFDYVVGSYASLASVKIAFLLKRKHPGIKLILDFRDELSQNYDVNPWSKFRLKIWEKRLLEEADVVSSVSEPILKYFSQFAKPGTTQVEIRNGFNFEPLYDPKAPGAVIEILYAGSLYHHIKLNNFFKAWLSLPHSQANKVRLKILGGNPTQWVPEQLRDLVTHFHRVSYVEVLDHLKAADAFLLVIPTSNRKGVYTGKLFDYLAVNRPILALVPEGDVAERLINDSGAGYCCPNEDVARIAFQLGQLYKDWQSGTLPSRNWNLIFEHHRKKQINKLEQLIQGHL